MPVAANHGTDMISKIVPIGFPMAWNTPEPQYHLVEALTVPPKFLHRKCEPALCGVQTRIVGSPIPSMPYSAVGQQLGELRFSGVATQRPPRPAASSASRTGASSLYSVAQGGRTKER